MNKLYFGDCLDILRDLYKENPKGFINLIYIDPPFNSKRDYNILFESIDLKDTNAQRHAFADTWSNVSYIDTLNELYELNKDLYDFLTALDNIRISKSAVSYLTTMAIRIFYMHKLLKETGSFYLHCDPTMSHYLKLVCDLIFGEKNFRNEITWKRSIAHSDAKNKFADVNDVILFYSKTSSFSFQRQYTEHDPEYIKKFYRHDDKDGKGLYLLDNISSPNPRPNLMYNWKGYDSPKKGWRYKKETMEKLHSEGRIYYPLKKDGTFDVTKRLRLKRYLNEQKGTIVSNNWDDIPSLQAHEKERLGYPTQKPEALLERIIEASSNQRDVVADFFCGCGTSIAVAQRLKREWLGVDISHLAIKLILDRLTKPYQKNKTRAKAILDNIEIQGFPRDIASAKNLSTDIINGRFEFQDWIVEIMIGGILNPKKIADDGYDGYLTFYKTEREKEIVLIEVKSGKVTVKNIREFIQVIERQKAAIGVFVCFRENVTQPMLREAKHQGYYDKDNFNDAYDRVQILTVEDLFEGRGIKMPESRKSLFKSASKKIDDDDKKQEELF